MCSTTVLIWGWESWTALTHTDTQHIYSHMFLLSVGEDDKYPASVNNSRAASPHGLCYTFKQPC